MFKTRPSLTMPISLYFKSTVSQRVHALKSLPLTEKDIQAIITFCLELMKIANVARILLINSYGNQVLLPHKLLNRQLPTANLTFMNTLFMSLETWKAILIKVTSVDWPVYCLSWTDGWSAGKTSFTFLLLISTAAPMSSPDKLLQMLFPLGHWNLD